MYLLNLFCVYLISAVGTIILHELIHLLVAKLLSVKTTFSIDNLIPSVTYSSAEKWWKISLISISPAISLFILGFYIPITAKLIVLKVILFLNILNIFPFTADGEAAIYALMKGVKE